MSCCSPHKKDNQKENHSHQSSCCSSPKENNHKESASHQHSCCSTENKKEGKKTIDRHMTIEEILGMFPFKAQKLSQEITNAGLHCVGCHAATWETLEAGMLGHGKTEAQIDELVCRLNELLEEKIELSSITLTPRGAAKFLEILESEGKQGWGMRFGEEMSSGCNDFDYLLDLSEKADEHDETFVSNGIEIHVKKALLPRLIGSEIDYIEGLRSSGFKISNPNARSSCGCGSSHGYN